MLGIGLNVTADGEFPPSCATSPPSLAIAAGDRRRRAGAGRAARAPGPPAGEPTDVLDAWRDRDALLGRPIRWDGGSGTAAGVDDSGALLVDTGAGRVALDAGEVHLHRAAGALRPRRAPRACRRCFVGVLRARCGVRPARAPPFVASPPPPLPRPRRRRRRAGGGPWGSSSAARGPARWACAPCACARRPAPAGPRACAPARRPAARRDRRRSCFLEACTSRRALRACAPPEELTSRPSRRLVSGQRDTAYSSCTSREYSARCQIQRRRLVAAADRLLGHGLQQHLDALAALVARPAAHQLDGLVERLGVLELADLRSARAGAAGCCGCAAGR